MNPRILLSCTVSLVLIAVLAAGCSEAPTALEELPSAISQDELALRQGPPMDEATVQFGRPEVGADFPPEEEHPSSHAKDALQPRTVVIAAGGTVTFDMALLHQVAIYEPGTRPEDIDTSELTGAPVPFPFPPLIDDEDGRVAVGPLSFPAPIQWSYTFEEPGRYLVICTVLPHFAEFDMYGWVTVK